MVGRRRQDRFLQRHGRAVKIAAAKGDEYVKKIMATDVGASQLGEYSLTDKRFSRIDK